MDRRSWRGVAVPLLGAAAVATLITTAGAARDPSGGLVAATRTVVRPEAAGSTSYDVQGPATPRYTRTTPPPCPRRVAACVDSGRKLAWLQHDGRISYGPVPVRLGGPDHPTPKGTFPVAWKGEHWVSTEYGIPMPWSVFFAPGGIAFHAGPLDEPSHGCVHLRRAAARAFFAALDRGDLVQVR